MLDETNIKSIEALKMFNPSVHGLKARFHLTSFANKSNVFHNKAKNNTNQFSVIYKGELRYLLANHSIDPIVDDPYMLGKMACVRVMNQFHEIGITECDHLSLQICNSNRMTLEERNVVVPLMTNGFRDAALEAGVILNETKTYWNQWSSIGGTISIACHSSLILNKNDARVGDVLILTKPLGTQIAIKAYDWKTSFQIANRSEITEEEIEKTFVRVVDLLARSNREASELMNVFQATCATDTSEFGLLAHAQNLAARQKNAVSFRIHNLPIIPKITILSKLLDDNNALVSGLLTETSGGLLICLPQIYAERFIEEHIRRTGNRVWVIGTVISGNRTAVIDSCPRILDSETDY